MKTTETFVMSKGGHYDAVKSHWHLFVWKEYKMYIVFSQRLFYFFYCMTPAETMHFLPDWQGSVEVSKIHPDAHVNATFMTCLGYYDQIINFQNHTDRFCSKIDSAR
jgi:hypothetical protein